LAIVISSRELDRFVIGAIYLTSGLRVAVRFHTSIVSDTNERYNSRLINIRYIIRHYSMLSVIDPLKYPIMSYPVSIRLNIRY
jgi:hypothetical protein